MIWGTQSPLRKSSFVLAAAAGALLVAATSLGEENPSTLDATGSIQGRITAGRDASLEGVTVTLSCASTGVNVATSTDQSGHYEIHGLPPAADCILTGSLENYVSVSQDRIVVRPKRVSPESFMLFRKWLPVDGWKVGDAVDQSKIHVHCEIWSLDTSYVVGESPRLKIGIVNDSESFIQLFLTERGSGPEDFYPLMYFEVSGPRKGFAMEGPFTGCIPGGRAIQIRDFVRVAPDAAFDPYLRLGPRAPEVLVAKPAIGRFKRPGQYTFTLHYSTNPPDPKKWHVPAVRDLDYNEMVDLFRHVALVETSCSVTVNVTSGSSSPK